MPPATAGALRLSRGSGRHDLHVCAAAATEAKEETFTYQAEVRLHDPQLAEAVMQT
jgi:hypothetical protein